VVRSGVGMHGVWAFGKGGVRKRVCEYFCTLEDGVVPEFRLFPVFSSWGLILLHPQ